MSSISAQNTLRKSGVNVGKSTICSFFKNTIIIDYDSITSIEIDDFALKKRHHYVTVFVNQENHCIISMITSRDIIDVANELKKFNNLKKITRDGPVIYKNAIELANPKIVQINDRFHILKSLSESISNELRANIALQYYNR